MQGKKRRAWRPAAIALAATLAVASTSAQQPYSPRSHAGPKLPPVQQPSRPRGRAQPETGPAPQTAPAPVRLRFASSLCASTTAQTLAMQRVPQLASSASAESSVNGATVHQLEGQRDAYFAKLDAIHPFNGLYATGDVNHTVLGPDFGGRYALGLE